MEFLVLRIIYQYRNMIGLRIVHKSCINCFSIGSFYSIQKDISYLFGIFKIHIVVPTILVVDIISYKNNKIISRL